MVDATQIERALGRSGTAVGDVFKVSVPRTDVTVTLDGFEIVPFMGLTSWAAFRRGPHGVTVMGDIVALEDEIAGAVSAAIDSALYVTALHNHFVREQPRVMFMHIEATADEVTLARGVRRILDAIETVRRANPLPRSSGKVSSMLSARRIEAIVAAKGELQDGVLKFTIGRPDVPLVCTGCGNRDINGIGRAEDLARTFRRALDELQRIEPDQACHPS